MLNINKENYINFEPSKRPLYNNLNQDNMYLFKNDKLMVKVGEEKYIIPSKEELEDANIEVRHLQCLGAYNGLNCYCGEVVDLINEKDYVFVDLRTYSRHLTEENFLVSAKARLLLDHNRANEKCGVCGSPTAIKEEGEDRAIYCTNCDNVVWPKTAPAIIVAVTKEDKLLLAHNKMFPEGMYSVLAGFVEMGETFEDCVRREVFEETGIKVHNIKYFGSQPWPFPNSMMIGFTAEYLEGEIEVDKDEITHAKWFTKEEIPGIYRRSISISTQLIDWFLKREGYK